MRQAAAAGGTKRLGGLDSLRGAAFVSMTAYHACWDLVWIFGMDWSWYRSWGAYLWQQSICWTFILLSGYCWALGRRKWRRGLITLGCGCLVSAVTLVCMPENAVRFGVLTLLGAASLLTAALSPLLARLDARAGIAGSFARFLLLRDVPEGFLGFEGARIAALPGAWYANGLTAFLGFPPADFFSTDYFPLLPWAFLFWCGYFLRRLRPEDAGALPRVPGLDALGRRSLLLYLLHQPVIYGVLMLLYA